jgi:hypothetical protein
MVEADQDRVPEAVNMVAVDQDQVPVADIMAAVVVPVVAKAAMVDQAPAVDVVTKVVTAMVMTKDQTWMTAVMMIGAVIFPNLSYPLIQKDFV